MSPIKAKKNLGQHFLKSRSLAQKIVARLDIKPADEIVEIGPGLGALTELLIGGDHKLTVVEIDRHLCRRLELKFGNSPNLRILNRDFFDFDKSLLPSRFKVIGNIPYNRTAGIIERLIELAESIELGIITVQEEVAAKLVAKPKEEAYGHLTVLAATAFRCERLFTIPANAFSPAPKVKSAVVKLTPADIRFGDADRFRAFLRACFFARRKMLTNSLRMALAMPRKRVDSLVAGCFGSAAVRAAELDLDSFHRLFVAWQAVCLE